MHTWWKGFCHFPTRLLSDLLKLEAGKWKWILFSKKPSADSEILRYRSLNILRPRNVFFQVKKKKKTGLFALCWSFCCIITISCTYLFLCLFLCLLLAVRMAGDKQLHFDSSGYSVTHCTRFNFSLKRCNCVSRSTAGLWVTAVSAALYDSLFIYLLSYCSFYPWTDMTFLWGGARAAVTVLTLN